jgi:peroxiredoxin Q/BCP
MTVLLDQPVPAFSAVTSDGQTVTPDSLRGRYGVLYFYPKDNTPGCTQEGQDFRDRHAEFAALDAVILGVSRDSVRSHQGFRDQHGFPFALISDGDETLCQLFDVIKLKKLYGKESLGIERSTFLLDREGVLRRQWRKVKVAGHADAVLAALRELRG